MKLAGNTVVVMNKIDSLQTEHPEAYIAKVRDFLVQYFRREHVDISEERIVPVSCKKETNIFLPDTPELTSQSLSDAVIDISDKILEQREEDLLKEYLPTRFSVLCTNKILGTGVIVQGFMLSGEVKIGQKVLILPQMIESEVAGIESFHQKTVGRGASKIIALNLKGIREDQVKKGDVLILRKEYGEWKNDELQNKMVQMKETILNMNLDQM